MSSQFSLGTSESGADERSLYIEKNTKVNSVLVVQESMLRNGLGTELLILTFPEYLQTKVFGIEKIMSSSILKIYLKVRLI